jgi:predicted amidohydrolase YtcJ
MKTVCIGRALQDAGYFERESQLKEKGAEAMKRLPRTNTTPTIGVHVGARTDAHRVASYNPWIALRWMLDGKTVGGAALCGPKKPSPTKTPCVCTRKAARGSRSRKKRARLTGSGEACGFGGAVEGLLQGAGGGDRGD